ncbi:MAG: DNA polymerase III subunit delta [Methylococcaceae bacterium]|nr:DNA polymerase III subunit delta [Methylococcaceae bacterium]
MKLRLEQLAGQLGKGLAPVYVLSGDEPLQLGEALDAIRVQARSEGYENRELFYADQSFGWGDFMMAADSMSLFGDRRLIDLRLPAKPDKEGAEALQRYGARPADDTVLVVSLPRLTAAEQKAKWFQALDAAGVFIQVWPLEGAQLIGWLDRRLGQRNMLADRSSLAILAARVEGNLLAAAQEIEKLHILYGSSRIDDDMMRKAVADSARYDVYDLAEAAMLGQMVRAHRVLAGLRAEGVAAPVALWALARDIRLVVAVKGHMTAGLSEDMAFARLKEKVFDKRRTGVSKAVQRLSQSQAEQALLACARTDRIIKGAEAGDDWDALLEVCLCLCGKGMVGVRAM